MRPSLGFIGIDFMREPSHPWLTKETAARVSDASVDMVDAGVAGARRGAMAAELVFMVGGTAEAWLVSCRCLTCSADLCVLMELGCPHTTLSVISTPKGTQR